MVEIAAIIYATLATVVVLFQCALALGAPWGNVTMGGFHKGVLPKHLRLAAVAQGVLVAGTAFVVLIEAKLLMPDLQFVTQYGIWFVVALYTVSSVLNIITSSIWERRIWTPVVLCMLISSLVVALM